MTPQLPPGFKYKRRGSCVPAVIVLLDQLEDGRDWIIQGLVKFAFRDTFTAWHEHTWMEVDGEIYDPTLIQFKCLKSYKPWNVQRRTSERYSVCEYRLRLQALDFEKLAFWNGRIREFGGVNRLK